MNVPQRRAIVSIHRDVEKLVAESGVQDGLALINAMHITASVFINDNEPGLHETTKSGSRNLRRSIRRRSAIITTAPARTTPMPITSGRSWAAKWWSRSPTASSHLGPWEHIFYYEFDGRRKKRVLVKIIGE